MQAARLRAVSPNRQNTGSPKGGNATMSVRALIAAAFCGILAIWLVVGVPLISSATVLALTEKNIRDELIGPPMKGTYVDGRPWDETYFANGSITYRDQDNKWQGQWSFRGTGFCTFYNDGANGGCWQILKISENCYEFYSMTRSGMPKSDHKGRSVTWVARGWRASQASTCDPEVGV